MDNGAVYKFEIVGKPRSQKNSKQIIWHGKRSPGGKTRPMIVDDAKVARWRKQAVKQLEGQWLGRSPLFGEFAVVLVCYLGTRQNADTDNLAAGPLDALQNAKVIDNDRQISDVVVCRRRDNDDPRVEIYLFAPERLHVQIFGFDKGQECTKTL